MGKANPAMYLIPGFGQLKLADEMFLAPGRRADRAMQRGLKEQEEVQKQSLAAAARQQQADQEALAAANRKQPDLAGLLDAEKLASRQGVGSTFLTGVNGIDPSRLKLARKSLLGS